jgi:hypothetical protein
LFASRLDVGSNPTVWLCEYDVVKEAVKTGAIAARPFDTMPTMEKVKVKDSKGL